MFDYNKLRGRIREKVGTENDFAKAIGMGRSSLSQKLNNRVEFSQNEIKNAVVVLEIEDKDIPDYFFAAKV
jgi:hypothetical protein